jgi:HAD superfamily hydrolase (TIGR01493 family)
MICSMAKAVMFDFSGTLFHCEDTGSWLRAALERAGVEAADAEVEACAGRLRACGGQPGGYADFPVPAHLAELWSRRDLTAADHRAAYTALIRQAGLPWPGLADTLYDRHYAPGAWQAYPDALSALELLSDRGVPAVVVSNIGWDLRTVFAHHGMDHLVAGYVLSFEAGVKKPDPRIFRMACGLLGHDPEDILMVGDDPVADAAAAAAGCAFLPVDHAPVEERPQALLDALAAAGIRP